MMQDSLDSFTKLCDQVSTTSRKSEKVDAVAVYLRGLPSQEAGLAARYLGGNPFAAWEERTLQVRGNLLWRSLVDLLGSDTALSEAYPRHRDLGTAAEDVLRKRGQNSGSLTLQQLAYSFDALANVRGPATKVALLNGLLAQASASGAKYIIKIMLGEMRIGMKESLVEEAIAKAYGAPLDRVKRAAMLTGDTAETLLLASEHRLEDARMRLFHPIAFMLASPATDAEEAFGLSLDSIVEDKYDGIRAQAHIEAATGKVRIYSRTLDEVSGAFPELIAPLESFQEDVILDGEILAWRGGRARPFRELQKRLGRKRPSPSMQSGIPVSYVIFDVLAMSGELVIDWPLRERKRALERLFSKRKAVEHSRIPSGLLNFNDGGEVQTSEERLLLAPAFEAHSSAHLEDLFSAAQARGNEGLMIKSAASEYSPGRRGKNWLKLKHELATLDVVVTAAEYGNGHRARVLSDYTFAVQDGARLLNVGKAFTGLTDAEIARMTGWFEEHTLRQYGHVREVDPQIVVEVAFNAVMRSERHNSGYALRFPRIVRLREDKPAREIDTLDRVREIYEKQDGTSQAA